jgi:hypothetical protein
MTSIGRVRVRRGVMGRRHLSTRTRAGVIAGLLGLAALLAPLGGLSMSRAAADTVPPPPPEPSPFTARDTFCTPGTTETAHSGSAGTARPITVVMLTPAASTGAGTGLGDPVAESEAFGDLVNQCGGINGRPLDLRVLVESSDPHADCIRATAGLHALIVVTWTQFDDPTCITNQQRTIFVTTGAAASNQTLATTHGRLFTTESTEGRLEARVLDLVDSRDLAGKRVAVIGPPASAASSNFARVVDAILAANHVHVVVSADAPGAPGATGAPASATTTTDLADRVRRSRAAAVITGSFDPAFIARLQTQPHPAPIYDLGALTDTDVDALRSTYGPDSAKFVDRVGLYTWSAVGEQEYRLTPSPGAFATACAHALSSADVDHVTTTTTTTTSPPDAASAELRLAGYQRLASICLAMRIVARGLYNAGADLGPASVERALHNLPYLDDASGLDAAVARPNQVINEPVTEVQQVVVLDRAEYPCAHPARPKDATDDRICLVPVSGWDDGGHAITGQFVAGTAAAATGTAGSGAAAAGGSGG